MKQKIPIDELSVGMYIDGVQEDWIKTPFLFHHFSVRNLKQISQLKELGLKYVYIDTEKFGDFREIADIPPEFEAKPEDACTQPSLYTKEELTKYYHNINLFTQIDRNTLIKGSFVDFSLYLKKNLGVVLLQKYENTDIEITDSIVSAEGDIVIEKASNRKYKNYLNDLFRVKSLQEPERFKHLKQIIVRENSKILVQELLDEPRSGEKLKECRGAVEEIVDIIEKNGLVISDLLTINKYDYYTYTHSVNVCVLTVGLALSLKMFPENEIPSIGIGALLHDIGKSLIPVEILNKPSMLTESEFTVMKQHVLMAQKILSGQKILLREIYHPVMEHHEKLSGKGYPRGLADGQIHPVGRLVSLIDTYDALTTARPYKKAFSPFEALSIIRKQLDDFDNLYYINLVKILGSIAD
ncbi:MAG: DUF3391 domain-containing protein [Nitrospirae bacterium YQR-1]